MTDARGPRSWSGTRSTSTNSPKSYIEGTTGLEQRDSVLVRLRENGHEVWTNSDTGYHWFAHCPTHNECVRVSSGEHIELACLHRFPDARCSQDDLIRAFGLTDILPVVATHLERLRDALVDSDGLERIPDPEPLIGPDVLFKDTLAWMVGKPGCGKSFVALDMAGCIGTGESWQGYKVEQGHVLYLVAEGVRGTKKRVRAWEQAMGHGMTGVTFLPTTVQAGVPAEWDALVTLAEEMKPALIILDTQARITVGIEENSNTAMGEFVARVERLRGAAECTVLIVHHIGRTGDTGRGATVLDGAMATILKVTKDDDLITVECQKSKDGEEWADILLRTVPMGESVVLAVDDGNERPDHVAQRCAPWLTKWRETFADEWVSVTTLIEAGMVAKNTFHTNKLKLIRAGAVERSGEGRMTRYRIPPS